LISELAEADVPSPVPLVARRSPRPPRAPREAGKSVMMWRMSDTEALLFMTSVLALAVWLAF
jgi:hypothetical protein